MAWRGGRWRGRLNLAQIEEQASQKISEFEQKLTEAGLSVPSIPPVLVEYLALTITPLSVRGVEGLSDEDKPLAGLLDTAQTEILYEESDPLTRQNFTIAHELGHYFLHFLPAVEQARQPTLFDLPGLEIAHLDPNPKLERAEAPAGRFFRCSELALATSESESEGEEDGPVGPGRGAAVGIETSNAPVEMRPRNPELKTRLKDPASTAQLAKVLRLKELADRIEWEANIFARGLLMPAELVRWLNKKHQGQVEAMAAALAVSQTALRYRLNGLGLRQDEDKGLGPGYNVRSKSAPPTTQGTFF